jgi:integrase
MATITNARVRAARPRAKMYEMTCSGLSGFVVRVLPSGKKVFLVRMRVDGRDQRVRIGSFEDEVTVEEARRRAAIVLGGGQLPEAPEAQPAGRIGRSRASSETLVEARSRGSSGGFVAPPPAARSARLVSESGDVERPTRARSTARSAPRVTIKALSERFLEEYVEVYLKPRSAANYSQCLRDHILPVLGDHDFREVTRADVQRLHAGLQSRPAAANYTLCVLGSLYSRIIKDWELAELRNPTTGVRRFRTRRVERFLTPEERRAVEEVLTRGVQLPVASLGYVAPMSFFAIKLLALTGLRRGEIQGLTWPMVDWQHAVLNLPDTKTGQRSVPVSSQVAGLLREIHAFSGEPRDGYVIRSSRGLPLKSLSCTWERIRALAGIPDVRIHDLRHSFASDALMGGVPLAVIGKMLGHRQLSTTQRYAHLSDRVVREALDHTASRITEAAQPMMPVPPLKPPFRPLTNTQWAKVAPLVLACAGKRGQPLLRGVIDGIRWRIHNHAAWQRIPAEFGRSTTCWRWFQRWENDGTWAEIVERVG